MLIGLVLSLLLNILFIAMVFLYYKPLVDGLLQDKANLNVKKDELYKNNTNLNKDYEVILKQAKAMEEKLENLKKITKRKGK